LRDPRCLGAHRDIIGSELLPNDACREEASVPKSAPPDLDGAQRLDLAVRREPEGATTLRTWACSSSSTPATPPIFVSTVSCRSPIGSRGSHVTQWTVVIE
jgi:hypothetical protein